MEDSKVWKEVFESRRCQLCGSMNLKPLDIIRNREWFACQDCGYYSNYEKDEKNWRLTNVFKV